MQIIFFALASYANLITIIGKSYATSISLSLYAFGSYLQGHVPPAVLFHRDMSQKHIDATILYLIAHLNSIEKLNQTKTCKLSYITHYLIV